MWDSPGTPWIRELWTRDSRGFASQGYGRDRSFVASFWHTFLIEPSGIWNLRKQPYICYDELTVQPIIEAERGCDFCRSFACSLSLSEVYFFSCLLNCVATGTSELVDGVLRTPGECCKKKLFPIDPLCSQLALYLDCFGCGGNRARANIQSLRFSGALRFVLRSTVNW